MLAEAKRGVAERKTWGWKKGEGAPDYAEGAVAGHHDGRAAALADAVCGGTGVRGGEGGEHEEGEGWEEGWEEGCWAHFWLGVG